LLVVAVLGCGVLFVLGFVSPARSQRPQLKVDRILGKGQRAGQKAAEKRPSLPGRLVEGPFEKARSAVAKSTGWGRKAQSKLRV
jgi:hypothetical protein